MAKGFRKITKRFGEFFEDIGKEWEDLIDDLKDEVEDFWEDFLEHSMGKKAKKIHKKRQVMLYGTSVLVRPAYIFAERIENF